MGGNGSKKKDKRATTTMGSPSKPSSNNNTNTTTLNNTAASAVANAANSGGGGGGGTAVSNMNPHINNTNTTTTSTNNSTTTTTTHSHTPQLQDTNNRNALTTTTTTTATTTTATKSNSSYSSSDSPRSPVATKSSSAPAQPPKSPEIDKNAFSVKRLEKFWETYKDADSNQIGPEGVEVLCKDLDIDPDDAIVLVMAWHMNCSKLLFIQRDEFLALQKLNVDSLPKLKAQLSTFKSELEDKSKFKDIYRYAFVCAKEPDQKILDLATADAMLGLVMGNRFFHVAKIRTFLTEQTTYKCLNMDQWLSILEFARTIKDDLTNYDEKGAWPVLLDEYCEWMADQKK